MAIRIDQHRLGGASGNYNAFTAQEKEEYNNWMNHQRSKDMKLIHVVHVGEGLILHYFETKHHQGPKN